MYENNFSKYYFKKEPLLSKIEKKINDQIDEYEEEMKKSDNKARQLENKTEYS